MAWSDRVNARIEAAARETLRELGREGVRIVRSIIGVRVQRFGSEVIRSEEGEPPRRDTSTLWRSIKFRVDKPARTTADLVIYSTDNMAKLLALELETSLNRPFWAPSRRIIKRRFSSEFKRRFAEKMRQVKADPFGSLPAGYQEDD